MYHHCLELKVLTYEREFSARAGEFSVLQNSEFSSQDFLVTQVLVIVSKAAV